MADADELERTLLARWDRDTLVVYSDALQARGDPRGELIALDLEIAERGFSYEVATRRRQRLYEWLGGSTILGRPWDEGAFRYGFATNFVVTHDRHAGMSEYVHALLASPAGRYVKGITIKAGDVTRVREALAVMVPAQWPWLETLGVSVVDEPRTPISEKLVRAFIAVTPRLHTLEIHGANAFAAFPHPAIRTYVTEISLLPLLASIPDASALDLSIADADDDITMRDIAPYLRATLRHVDLSRNEPSYPPSAEATDIYPLARELPLAQLARLRLPSLRTPRQVETLLAILEQAPRLDVEVARIYQADRAQFDGVTHPRLHLPVPRMWPQPDTLSSREALTITLPTEEYGDDVSLTQLIDHLEEQLDELFPDAQAAWADFWTFLASLGWETETGEVITLPFSATTLRTAVEPLDFGGFGGAWAQLVEKLQTTELPPDATVSVRRYWGW